MGALALGRRRSATGPLSSDPPEVQPSLVSRRGVAIRELRQIAAVSVAGTTQTTAEAVQPVSALGALGVQ